MSLERERVVGLAGRVAAQKARLRAALEELQGRNLELEAALAAAQVWLGGWVVGWVFGYLLGNLLTGLQL